MRIFAGNYAKNMFSGRFHLLLRGSTASYCRHCQAADRLLRRDHCHLRFPGFTRHRARFEREFQRAKANHAKLYLLIENASWEKAIKGDYRSRMHPKALLASLTAWLARYDCQIIMCDELTSPRLIRELLYREVKEMLGGDDRND